MFSICHLNFDMCPNSDPSPSNVDSSVDPVALMYGSFVPARPPQPPISTFWVPLPAFIVVKTGEKCRVRVCDFSPPV